MDHYKVVLVFLCSTDVFDYSVDDSKANPSVVCGNFKAGSRQLLTILLGDNQGLASDWRLGMLRPWKVSEFICYMTSDRVLNNFKRILKLIHERVKYEVDMIISFSENANGINVSLKWSQKYGKSN